MTKRRAKICKDCKTTIKRFREYKGNVFCFRCYRKKVNILGGEKGIFSMKKALSKTYLLKGYAKSNGQISCIRSFPSILIGHKVKLQLIE